MVSPSSDSASTIILNSIFENFLLLLTEQWFISILSSLYLSSLFLLLRQRRYKYRPGTTSILTEKIVPLELEVVQETVQRMDTAWTWPLRNDKVTATQRLITIFRHKISEYNTPNDDKMWLLGDTTMQSHKKPLSHKDLSSMNCGHQYILNRYIRSRV